MALIEIKELVQNQYDSAKLDLVLSQMEKIMATLDQIIADVTNESSQLDSLSTLMAGIEQQLKDALSGTTLPPPVQAKVDAIFAQTEANAAKIAQAINSNTPASNIPANSVGTPPVPATPPSADTGAPVTPPPAKSPGA